MKILNFKEHPVLRAYTLYVCHRFLQINKGVFGEEEYRRRRVEDIQRSEDFRLELHRKAVEFLEEMGFSDKEACKILEDECERLANVNLRELKEGECYCGCCREVLKTKDFKKHQEENKILHGYLFKELLLLSQEATFSRMELNKKEKK